MRPRLPVLRERRVSRSSSDPDESRDDLLTRAEVCRRLGISRWTLIRWVAVWERLATRSVGERVQIPVVRGSFPPPTHRIGGRQRWERGLVDAWIATHRV